jgi:hypothetical protein
MLLSPPPTPRKRARGSSGRWLLLIFATCWTAFALLLLMLMGKSGALFTLIPLLFVVVGVVMMAAALAPAVASLKIGKPEVSLPERVRLGEAFTFELTQPVRRAVEIEAVTVRFVFRESATYQRGTDTHTDTHDEVIDEFRAPGRRCAPGDVVTEQCRFQVPERGMHTFVAPSNKLQWFVQLHVAIPGWPDFKEDYEIPVLPERAVA